MRLPGVKAVPVIRSRRKLAAMKIISRQVTLSELREMAALMFGDMVKAVVDVDKELLAVSAELHSDLEALLMENGSLQQSLWGINLYPELEGEQFVEFDSMINLRPSKGNRSRSVESADTREQILRVLAKRIRR
jgi:hypothetical protein